MNRLLLVGLGLSLIGCSESGLQQVPNSAPVARAFVWEGEGIESDKRLGYRLVDELVTLDGSASFDEDARGAMTYDWTVLSAPDGSSVQVLNVPEDDPETEDVESAFPTFTPDMLGTYRFELVVTDTRDGVSTPALVHVQAVPPSQLSITLQWDVGGADLDLHLVRGDGTYFDVAGGSDCFSWNPTPGWGSTGSADDDPVLARDNDGEGQGPYRETITLAEPPDGDYRILVHYFSDHVDINGGNSQVVEAELDVKVLGRNITETIATPAPMQAGQVWEVRELSWPGQALNTLGNGYTTHESLGGPDYFVNE